jgi:hypothetical protein
MTRVFLLNRSSH